MDIHQETALTAHIIHAFTGRAFRGKCAKGNPAAVVMLKNWPTAQALLRISQILAQPVTAFLVERAEGYDIRRFSPDAEINLCGHGSLAAAACILETAEEDTVSLFSPHGNVVIERAADRADDDMRNSYRMKMPAWQGTRNQQNWQDAQRLGLTPADVFSTRDLVIVLDSEQQVRDYQPDFTLIKNLKNHHAVILTASQGKSGYVLRNFAPKIGINEDTATGSAQCSLAPYWLEKLGQEDLEAHQLSSDGGYFRVSPAQKGLLFTVQAEKKATVSLA
ncbi:PhzF family phenazine biosynthesis protein [Photobacterium sp. CCB-ST2H9]|uniref:PhzF family phenazine biosynthesis protein n=1 Tax=Photobacterium sp. CCB-ST2H9 TaxID=2912855 RepID=UPI0020061AE2|nr:PhzF family phenazine biosynthesis protein [Photobacterium sp. CCB-ST2H9]UTM59809.1 PhzF family phenazine biosynthesis protein [Photobacterium sp. CCB-ST2H9]